MKLAKAEAEKNKLAEELASSKLVHFWASRSPAVKLRNELTSKRVTSTMTTPHTEWGTVKIFLEEQINYYLN